MPERDDHDPTDWVGIRRAMDLELKRISFAAERVADHAERELALLELATQVSDDAAARELEYQADAEYRDFVALIEEHGLDD
jgi:hypothetical protein